MCAKTGFTEIWTRIAGFRVKSANHFVISWKHLNKIVGPVASLLLSEIIQLFFVALNESRRKTLKAGEIQDQTRDL